jgi:hypothetical protein
MEKDHLVGWWAGIKMAVADTCHNSTIHALPNIARSDNLLIKAMWLVCFLGSAGFCVFLIVESIQDYLQYDVVTKISSVYEMPAPFPTVTICIFYLRILHRRSF